MGGILICLWKKCNGSSARFIVKQLFSFHCSPRRMRSAPLKKNPLKNTQVMLRLNPYTQTFRRQQALLEMKRRKSKEGGK